MTVRSAFVLAWLTVAVVAISSLSSGPALANPGLDRWGGIVFLCSPPIPAQNWGEDACAFLAEEAARQAQALNVPLISAPPERAGVSGGPENGTPPFIWAKALRMLARYDSTGTAFYSWGMTVMLYDHPADANGEYLESRWQFVFQQGATLLEGQELKGTKETAPLIFNGLLSHLFADK